jgi:hypothetical protein
LLSVFLFFQWIFSSLNAIFEILFSFLKISAVLAIFFFAIILIWDIFFKWQEGIVVLPFETPTDEGASNYNGKAISDLITSELCRIRKIDLELDFQEISIELGTSSGQMRQPSVGWSEKGQPTLIPSGERLSIPKVIPLRSILESNIADIGSVTVGSATLSLGTIIVAFKRICPGSSWVPIMRGSVQIYGNILIITGCLEKKNEVHTWEVRRKILVEGIQPARRHPCAPTRRHGKDKPSSDQFIPSMIRDLAFKIYYDLAKEPQNHRLRRGP